MRKSRILRWKSGGALLTGDSSCVDASDPNAGAAYGATDTCCEGQVSLPDHENLAPVYTEYNVGNYLRRFTVSSDIDTDHITACMANGVLEVELPKAESAKPRRIPVAVH